VAESVFLDTNVLLYSIGQDNTRTPIAEGLVEAGGVISVQVLNELAAVAHRKLRMPWPDVLDALAAIRTLCPVVVPITLETHDAALRLATRYDVSIYDALIMAAAIDAGCTTLYSEDLQDGQVIERRLTIRNPFAGSQRR
jgi:predicted nucleic acid-binding protein